MKGLRFSPYCSCSCCSYRYPTQLPRIESHFQHPATHTPTYHPLMNSTEPAMNAATAAPPYPAPLLQLSLQNNGTLLTHNEERDAASHAFPVVCA